MAKVDLSGLDLDGLNSIIEEATKLRDQKVEEKRADLMKQLQALDAIGKPKGAPASSRQRAAPQPKYRSLKDPSQTWAGRGGTPRWLAAEMEETGKKLEDFAV